VSIVATINAVQTVNAAIAGVKRAPELASYPASLNSDTDCPFAFAWPSGGQWDEAAIGLNSDVETITISVLVAPVSQGIRGTTIALAVTLLEAFRVAYLADENQDLADTVEQINSAQHAGLQTLSYAGVEYYGFQITITTLLKEIP
jgi:hypothetical protein